MWWMHTGLLENKPHTVEDLWWSNVRVQYVCVCDHIRAYHLQHITQ